MNNANSNKVGVSTSRAKRRRQKFNNSNLESRQLVAALEAPYFWITKAAHDRLKNQISDSAATAVYVALCRLQNDAGRDLFYASLVQIAALAGCGQRTVQTKIVLLNRHGLIAVQSAKRTKDLHEANRYFIASTRSATVAIRVRQTNPDSIADSKEPQTGGSLTTSAPIGTSGDVAPDVAGAQDKGGSVDAW
jgi:hypothetical protein